MNRSVQLFSLSILLTSCSLLRFEKNKLNTKSGWLVMTTQNFEPTEIGKPFGLNEREFLFIPAKDSLDWKSDMDRIFIVESCNDDLYADIYDEGTYLMSKDSASYVRNTIYTRVELTFYPNRFFFEYDKNTIGDILISLDGESKVKVNHLYGGINIAWMKFLD